MINEFIERPAPEVVQGFRNLLSYDSLRRAATNLSGGIKGRSVTCAISDCMGRFNAMTSEMSPLFEGIRIAGTAVTVKTLAADVAAEHLS